MSFFIDELLGAPTPLIMEVKRRDGRGEDLFGARSVREILDEYHRLGAPCLSVVTGSWFGGDDELLAEVAAMTDRPILKKDFITREREIAEARAMGAAAVLLTAELLPGSVLGRLVEACLRHELTPFVEISSARQLERVADPQRCAVAVNNKDIRRRERGDADIGRSLALLPAVRKSGAGCAVSASGIASPDVAARLLDAGFQALLVGTGLLVADDAQDWLDTLEREREAAAALQRH